MRGAKGSAEGWKDLGDEHDKEDERNVHVVRKWAQFLTKYLKIRKLQHIFSASGTYLNTLVSKECRERLSRTYSLKK